MAFVGVNLEGKKYDGWPIGRFIERELQQSMLFDVVPRLAHIHDIEVVWYRDAWQAASRPPIDEKFIGGSPQLLHQLTPEQWKRLLVAPDAAARGVLGRLERRHPRYLRGHAAPIRLRAGASGELIACALRHPCQLDRRHAARGSPKGLRYWQP